MRTVTVVLDCFGRRYEVEYVREERYDRIPRAAGGKEWYDSIAKKPRLKRKVLLPIRGQDDE